MSNSQKNKSRKIKQKNIVTASFEPSPQLNMLIQQLGITKMRDLIDPKISNDELDQLLNTIMFESRSKITLMDIVKYVSKDKKIKKQNELTNLKIKVLLDNLANKMCNCRNVEQEGSVNMEPICRSNIFQKRDIDFITYDCGAAPKNKSKYNYGLGPILRPAIRSKSKVVLRRYHKSAKPTKKI
jgi:hypothetical protein